MTLKNISDRDKPQRKALRVIIEIINEIIVKLDTRIPVFDLAVNFSMPKSTIHTILKKNNM